MQDVAGDVGELWTWLVVPQDLEAALRTSGSHGRIVISNLLLFLAIFFSLHSSNDTGQGGGCSVCPAFTASKEDAAVYTTSYKTTVDAGHLQHTRNRAAIAC